MQDYDFEEEQQVRSFLENTKKPKGGNPKLDNQVRTKLSKDFSSFLSESSRGCPSGVSPKLERRYTEHNNQGFHI